MVDVLGYDIGGANTKAVFISTQKGKLREVRVTAKYFPIWKEPEKLVNTLLELKKKLDVKKVDCLGVTMTAELSDIYSTKREGVRQVLTYVKQAFPRIPIFVSNTEGNMEPFTMAEKEPLNVAAANWAATGWLVAQLVKDCAVVDVGSTSTSIIPIRSNQIVAKGKTDLDKLICGELVYTGSLRTNVATIVHSVPTRNGVANVASEIFASSGDIHLILGHITSDQYTSETADGREKTLTGALARLARVVCADTEILTQQEIIDIARYIYDQQIMQVVEGLTRVYSYMKTLTSNKIPVVITGLGKDFIARKATEKVCVDELVDLGTLIQRNATLATPAFAVALMAANKFNGEIVNWKLQ